MNRSMFRLAAGTVLSLTMGSYVPSASAQLIIGHRGAGRDAPENTLASFRLAFEQGADGVEGDYRLTSDGRVMCIHDADTERVAGKKLVVKDSTFNELRALDVGAWKGDQWRGEQIPSLEEVLAEIPDGKTIVIEIKVGPEIVEPVARILANSSIAPARVLIIGFDAEAIAECKKRLPNVRAHWLSGYKEQDNGRDTPTVADVATTIRQTRADGFGSEAKPATFNAEFVHQLQDLGCREFHVWTVDDPAVATFYKHLGAVAITTNRPGWLREQLKALGED